MKRRGDDVDGSGTKIRRRHRADLKDGQDFDGLVEVRVLPFDAARAQEAIEALVDLLLDAQAREDAQAAARRQNGYENDAIPALDDLNFA